MIHAKPALLNSGDKEILNDFEDLRVFYERSLIWWILLAIAEVLAIGYKATKQLGSSISLAFEANLIFSSHKCLDFSELNISQGNLENVLLPGFELVERGILIDWSFFEGLTGGDRNDKMIFVIYFPKYKNALRIVEDVKRADLKVLFLLDEGLVEEQMEIYISVRSALEKELQTVSTLEA
jgi:hypothetical protein